MWPAFEDRPRKVPRRDSSEWTTAHTHTEPSMEEAPDIPPAPPQLLSRLQPLDPDTFTVAEAQVVAPTATPISPQCGFPALIPIIHCRADNSLHAPDGLVPLTADGELDFSAYPRYIYATGHISPDGTPNFQTTLVRRGRFQTPEAIAARKTNSRIPFVDLVLGGRDGVLISPIKDPRSQQEITTLFNARDKKPAREYIERVRFTPPELCGSLHSRALDHWTALQIDTIPSDRPEPSPATHPTIWKRWLREKHTADVHFQYIGVPLVGKGFQNAHVDGNRALLACLPLNIKGTAIRNGPLRTNFMSTAAALLGVPRRYEQLISEKQLPIYKTRRSEPYNEKQSRNALNPNIEDIARYLAQSGVTPNEAEQWRPWATAYIEMTLSTYPDGTHTPTLKQARNLARERIADEPALALRSVHVDAPGNYNPIIERSREARRSQLASCGNETDTAVQTPHQPMAESSSPITPYVTPDDFAGTYILDPTQIHGWDDENMRMGPG
ncbi:hypothetical protein BGW80DRAFT_1251648 [Lactifluus volemus]|nr:hypothetical protein BGW80DRAFT_1251648 [Lactifluus volemus]